ncbi:MAG: glycoside hydrolase family 43 protein [Chloroflexi bacterium]|nr:glycoside hydrolase family 43 protein [Chloroflexota bacterium]
MKFRNPILPGFHPDPTICRVGEDYYLVTSTFEYFPGLPIFHSLDLVHWRQIGHVIHRPTQLSLDGLQPSKGLYAPTLRYHNGTFYVINTLVPNLENPVSPCGNFIVTATDPAGPWSDPYWLDPDWSADGAPGIDPSLLFDDDGRAWYTGNRIPPAGESYTGHREIWLQELDLDTMQLTGPKYSLWDGAAKGAIHAEAPHLYKIDGMYYLLIAEGGTDAYHAVTMARSKSVTGPYVSCGRNPILTHRDRGYFSSIAATGHADLIETHNGEWWLVALGVRPYSDPFEPGYYYNLGRETFLAPVRWEMDGWPVVNPGRGGFDCESPVPNLPAHPWPEAPARDEFDAAELALTWNFLRTPREDFWSLTERPGHLRLRLRPEMLSEWVTPSFVGRRQQHMNFAAQTVMDFTPASEHECAGLVVLQNSDYHFRLEQSRANGTGIIRLIKREKGEESTLAEKPLATEHTYLKIEARGQAYSFWASADGKQWDCIAGSVDGRILSTTIAGGFVGAYIGMYASSSGQPSETTADFDWFEYMELGES